MEEITKSQYDALLGGDTSCLEGSLLEDVLYLKTIMLEERDYKFYLHLVELDVVPEEEHTAIGKLIKLNELNNRPFLTQKEEDDYNAQYPPSRNYCLECGEDYEFDEEFEMFNCMQCKG
tara:strand:+ start:52 stop:408 length:357 start_codon:yes stop_codon:yes gene_type:complete